MSVKDMVRKAAIRAAGFVEIPFGGTVGMSPEQERASAVQAGRRPVWFPDDPRHSHLFAMHSNGDREATPEESAMYLELDKGRLDRAGLTFAEPGDPDAFTVKWTNRARVRERINSECEVQEVDHV